MRNKILFVMLLFSPPFLHASLFSFVEIHPEKMAEIKAYNSHACDKGSYSSISEGSDVLAYWCHDDPSLQIRHHGRTIFMGKNWQTTSLPDGRGVFVINDKIYVLRKNKLHRVDNCMSPRISTSSSLGYVEETPLLVQCSARWYFFDAIESVNQQSEWRDVAWYGRGFISFKTETGWDVVDFSGSNIMHSVSPVVFASEAGYVTVSNDKKACVHFWKAPSNGPCDLKYVMPKEGNAPFYGRGFFFFDLGGGKYLDPFYNFKFHTEYLLHRNGVYIIIKNNVHNLYTKSWKKLLSSQYISILEHETIDNEICSHISSGQGHGVVCGEHIKVPFKFEDIGLENGVFYCRQDGKEKKCF